MPDANDLSVLQKYIDQCSNWGRWGADDELGAVNLITEAKVREGVSLVKYGKSIPLTMAYDNHGPQRGAASLGGRNNPTLYQTMTGPGYLMGEQDFLPPHHKCSGHGVGFYDDILMMPTQSGTQWDALCHAFWDGKMYNGRSASEAGGGAPGETECTITPARSSRAAYLSTFRSSKAFLRSIPDMPYPSTTSRNIWRQKT